MNDLIELAVNADNRLYDRYLEKTKNIPSDYRKNFISNPVYRQYEPMDIDGTNTTTRRPPSLLLKNKEVEIVNYVYIVEIQIIKSRNIRFVLKLNPLKIKAI